MSRDADWIVYCERHRHYLVYAGPSGTTWTDEQAKARVYPTKPAARKAAEKATWLDHRPIVWARAETTMRLVRRGEDA